jgi:hypothetical protein
MVILDFEAPAVISVYLYNSFPKLTQALSCLRNSQRKDNNWQNWKPGFYLKLLF